MSRVGKKPIIVPAGVSVNIDDHLLKVKSSKGDLEVPFSSKINVTLEGSTIRILPAEENKKIRAVENKKIRALWGLTRALIYNAVEGVHKEWEKVLEMYGIGYRAQLKGKNLDLQVGFSHPIVIVPPKGISFETVQELIEGQNVQVIKVKGINKQLVGDVAAKIHAIRPPEPYKGKGIRYRGEYVRKKAGKATG